MTALDLLREARKWLDAPSHWCEGSFVRFADGAREILATADDAKDIVATCAAGSYYAVAIRQGLKPTDERIWSISRMLHRIAIEMGYAQISHLNDAGGHTKALELLDRGIAKLEDQQALFVRLEAEMHDDAFALA